MLDDASSVLLGKVTGFLGLKGFLKVQPATNNPSLFIDADEVILRISDKRTEVHQVEDMRLNKQSLELLLADCSTRSSVEHFLNAEIYVDKSQMTDLSDNEWFVGDLIGLEVFTTTGKFVGTVCDALGKQGEFLEIFPNGDNTKETILVPFVRQLVPLVDLKAKRIEVVDLPGLLELPNFK